MNASAARHREATRDRNRKWREANPTYMRDISRARRAANPEYDRQHPASRETKNVADRRRVARMRGVTDLRLTAGEWRAILAAANGRCFYCGEECTKLQQEHRVPISRGGAHAASNVVAACGPCNLRKRTMTDVEFLASLCQ